MSGVGIRPPEEGNVIERTVTLGAREVLFRASDRFAEDLDGLVRRLVEDGIEAEEGGEVDLGWDLVRFDADGDRLVATTKDGASTRRTIRRPDVTQLLWVLASWRRVAALTGTEVVPTYWRDSLYMTVDILKTAGVLECRRIDFGASTQWFIGGAPFDDALVDRLAGDIARCVEAFKMRPEAVAVLGLPIGYVGVVHPELGVIEVRDTHGAVIFTARPEKDAGAAEDGAHGPRSAVQQRLVDVGVALWRRMVGEEAPLHIELLPDDGAVVIAHAVRGGGRIYVASDETALFAASGAPPHEALEVFRSGRRTPPEHFQRREGRRSSAVTSFTAVPARGADAPLITEDELAIWGHVTERRAAWARDLLMRSAATRGEPFDRDAVRYAVTNGPDEIAVVSAAQGETIFVAADETVLRVSDTALDAETYAAFQRGTRTSVEDFGPRLRADGSLSREALAARTEDLARRAGIEALSRSAGDLAAIGDIDVLWLIREEDGEFVAYRVERGAYREIARSTAPDVVLAAVEAAIEL